MARTALAFAALLWPATATFAQQPASPLGWLHGRWTGTGMVQGAPSEAMLEVAPALGGRFVELRYVFTTGGERPVRFEGRGFYRHEAERWRGQWFESTGMTRPLSGEVAGTRLTTEWGEEATERGRTTYRLEDGDTLRVTDEVLRLDGQWQVFASHSFRRS